MSKNSRSIGKRLLALSTARRINAASDDAAGFSLARSLEARSRGLSQALENIGTASNVLSIAEGGYLAIADLLQNLKELVVQGADDSHGTEQRAAIQGQIDALVTEIDAIVAETQFGGAQLINGDYTSKNIQTGASAGEVLTISLQNADSAALFNAEISVANATVAAEAIEAVDSAINRLNEFAQSVGELLARLSSKEDTLSVAVLNTEATRSRIEDADFALESMELVRAQMMQHADFAALAQANAAPQQVLALF